ncbi:hypothetical protein B0H13DRAFT_892544 [Mycena leptocephala]|nr:hypothetical protein B0H13DRAFT_892544 [Mycena leptocephala]
MSALEADRARVAELAAQILRLESSLSALRTEKALAEQRIDAYKYPVLTLPNEITSEIFLHFLPFYPLCPPLTGNFSPTLLTQICRRWREIALGTPALWRAIALSDEPDDIPFERQADIGDVWLSRSGTCLLSVCVDGGRDGNSVLEPALAAVVPHRERWEYLTLRLLVSVPPTIAGPMPLLRHLDFEVSELADDTDAVEIVLLELPLLRTAIFNHIAASWVVLPWTQLTSLTLKHVLPREWIPILQQTSNLVHCDLILYPIYGHSPEIPDITLPHLESLIMTETEPDEGITPSRYFTFIVPALRSLQIPEKYLGERPIDALTALVSRSGCSLEKVCITGQRISITKDSYIHAFPAIPKMSLWGCYAKDVVDGKNSDLSNGE